MNSSPLFRRDTAIRYVFSRCPVALIREACIASDMSDGELLLFLEFYGQGQRGPDPDRKPKAVRT